MFEFKPKNKAMFGQQRVLNIDIDDNTDDCQSTEDESEGEELPDTTCSENDNNYGLKQSLKKAINSEEVNISTKKNQ